MRARGLWAVAALQAAVAISWKAYGYFQPRLLAHFGFDALAGALGWYLAFAGSTLAPLAGAASDRLVRSGGDRFPVVRAGVVLAVASFVAVAAAAGVEAESALRFTLPLFVAIWIAGMTLLQAPALAILRDVPAALARAGEIGGVLLAAVAALAASVAAGATKRLGGTLGSGAAVLLGLVAAVACRAIAPWCSGAVAAVAVAVVAGGSLGLHLT